MRNSVRVMLATVLMTAMIGPGQAHALLNAQCGGYYSGTTACMFVPVGPAISITGWTTGTSVRVRVTDLSGNVLIIECTGQTSCNGHLGISSTGTDSVGPPQGVGPLTCTVITSGSGYYRCQSNI